MNKTPSIQMTKGLILNFAGMAYLPFDVHGSALITGVNGVGKSTLLDALTYLYVGNTKFNSAAKDKDRDIISYVRGEQRSETSSCLRSGDVTSYIVAEFYDSLNNRTQVAGVCIELRDSKKPESTWFFEIGAKIDDYNFFTTEGSRIIVTPRHQLLFRGSLAKKQFISGKTEGISRMLHSLGIRCELDDLKTRLQKTLSFVPQGNVDEFIKGYILPEKKFSLDKIRKQREVYKNLLSELALLTQSKEELEAVISGFEAYTAAKDDLTRKELLLTYQEVYSTEKAITNVKAENETLDAQLQQILLSIESTAKDLTAARNQQLEIDKNPDFHDISNLVSVLKTREAELQEKINKTQKELDRLSVLQTEAVGLIGQDDFLLSGNNKHYIENLVSDSCSYAHKTGALHELSSLILTERDKLNSAKAVFLSKRNSTNATIRDLEEKKRQLERNKMVYPKDLEDGRAFLQGELKKRGISTEVRFLAELVTGISDDKWTAAIEQYMGNHRFYMIVAPEYAKTAFEIMDSTNGSVKGHVVLTDKLPDFSMTPDSAAAILKIENVSARKYVNYLLNGIHLCNDADEARNHPTGALTASGTLVKGFAVRKMDLRNVQYFIGADAIKKQLKQTCIDLTKASESLVSISTSISQIAEKVAKLDSFLRKDLNGYDYDAPKTMLSVKKQLKEIQQQRENYKNDVAWIAYQNALKDVAKTIVTLEEQNNKLQGKKGAISEKLRANNSKLDGTLPGSLQSRYNEALAEFNEAIGDSETLKEEVVADFIKTLKDKNIVYGHTSIKDARRKAQETEKLFISAQSVFRQKKPNGIFLLGAENIAPYYQEYQNICNCELEKCRNNIAGAELDIRNSLVIDYIGSMQACIDEAYETVEELNQQLVHMKFGKDTYRFLCKENDDYRMFFHISKEVRSTYMGNPELMEINEDLEISLNELMDNILDENKDTLYSDYRNFLVFDMKITTITGDNIETFLYSKKQNSASNGEKQTPYYLILAASLLTCYPKTQCCSRLVFIDEAYHAFSDDRIQQLVNLFEENNFQVFYAAPPGKIGSIGEHVNTVISLGKNNRYTFLVECLTREDEK